MDPNKVLSDQLTQKTWEAAEAQEDLAAANERITTQAGLLRECYGRIGLTCTWHDLPKCRCVHCELLRRLAAALKENDNG